jgi:hypothetical protein
MDGLKLKIGGGWMTSKRKQLAFDEWVNGIAREFVENPTPAQLEAFMQGYATFMESYNDYKEEAEPQAD